ncbi:hypothetical protein GCM10010106_46550 [Thermopolyspora flexuosa]|uniref:Uncharacterized protein n=1 Tax=Thermopolyspora flexuosa TaxID=103836 RepID=A0A543IWR0_9ACTN|nr:hypothetical protein FHX40_1676 [Thermopolyspora flexuosa]GGM92940.1 hypothetical protein GCM10010106_46550 [Thermopolyspora flexuosa]
MGPGFLGKRRRDRETEADTEVNLVTGSPPADMSTGPEHPLEKEVRLLRARLDRVERQIQALADANATLARGVQGDPLEPPGVDRAVQAARLARELLLAAGLVGRAARPEDERPGPRVPGDGGTG